MSAFIEHPPMYFGGRKQTRAIEYVVTKNGCHECVSHQPKSKEYPIIAIKQKLIKIHRFVWEKHHGIIPDGMFICHTCDNKRCINIEHLFLGTPRDNWEDMFEKNRHKFHKFTESERAKIPYRKGQAISWSKLSDEAVKEIRNTPKIYGSGIALARKYNVSQSAISAARTKRKWKHVE